MKCPKCQIENREGAKFCNECGHKFDITCPGCGTNNGAGSKFCDECGHDLIKLAEAPTPKRKPSSYTPKHLADRILQSRSALEGERKHVTVLFADVKGSMELAKQVDPEEWHRILDRFFRILSDGVHRFEGTINQYTGDGIMALFGAPIAHEDHAQRACWAALWLRDELRRYAEGLRLERGLDFGVRMGLNSGEVVVGKIGDDLRMDYTAQGQTVGLAARVEQLAASDSVCLSEHTARLAEGFFELRDLGQSKVKGVAESFRVYELEGVGQMRTRLEVARLRGFSRFVGRDDEMKGLELALNRAIEGNGQVVGVVGETGVGKSRLCLEFVDRCRAREILILEAQCPAHGKTVPLLPILELLRNSFGISGQDRDQAVREKIAGRLLLLDQSFSEVLPLVFDFLGVPDPERPVLQMDPEARQRQLFSFVRWLVESRSKREPAVLLFDDIQWIDPGSDAFLAQLVEATRGTRTLLLTNFRPEYEAEWVGRPYYQQVALSPLAPEAIDELLEELLGGDPTLVGLAERIRARTGGNPFFIEEVVQSLAELGDLERTQGGYRLTQPVDTLEIPPTVQVVLMARIDRLHETEKRILQTASVIGKQFSELLLKRVEDLPEAGVDAALSVLRETDFIREEALYPEVEYAFKHPLTHEVAYTSQLSEPRRHVHGRVALALEEIYADKLDENAALIAHHWEAAGERLEAARWRAHAADLVSRTDMDQAYRDWDKVIDLLGDAEVSEQATKLAIEAYNRVLRVGGVAGMPFEETCRVFKQGIELAERAEDASGAAYLEAAFVDRLAAAGRLTEATKRLPPLLQIITQGTDLELRLATVHSVLHALYFAGQHKDALEVVNILEPLATDDPDLGTRFSAINPLCSLHAWKVWLIARQGHLDEARRALEVALALARQYEPQAAIWILGTEAQIAMYTGEPANLERAVEACQLAEEIGSSYWQGIADGFLGLAHKTAGDLQAARSRVESALEFQREVQHSNQPEVMGCLAEICLHLGDRDRAGVLAQEAVEVARERGATVPGQSALLSLSRVLLRSDGPESRDDAATAIERGLALTDQAGTLVLIPQFLAERAELARLRGNESGRLHDLREAHRLFVEMGATGYAQRLATELGI